MVQSQGRARSQVSRIRVSLAVVSVLAAAAAASSVMAQTAPQNKDKDKDDTLQEVVVTGSLIPTTKEVNVPTPTLTISAQDLQNNGFSTIAEALQRGAFSTGSVQGPAEGGQGGFTAGAQTLSMFGLDPSFTKYLIDGKPMGNYLALYNGNENFNSISGIPIELVDHIDILPGGQSSLYGSDAVAGVINIVLKKKIDALTLDARYGWTKDGSGTDKRFAIADSFSWGGLTVMGGVQYERTQPIWGFQRPLTAYNNNSNPSYPAYPERDILILGNGIVQPSAAYYFEDPNNCSNVSGLFGGTMAEYTRRNHPDQYYCGSNHDSYFTLSNGDSGIQGYMHSTYDLNEHVQFYADTLLNHDVVSYATYWPFYSTDYDPNYSLYYDPNFDEFMSIQKIFAPEEMGAGGKPMNEDITNAFRVSAGARGTIVGNWSYDASFTYDQQKLTETQLQLFNTPLDQWVSSIMGPDLGLDPYFGSQPTYQPNYAALYQPVTLAQFAAMSGFTRNYSYTEDSLARGVITNPALFHLPGGDAGVALVAEGGREGWNYAPDARYDSGEVYAVTTVAGSGMRTRYAGTMELRLPVLPMLTATGSGRYDDYETADVSFNKFTYNVGLEFKPLKQVTFRGRYGTAFKAPTLADEYQGPSSYYSGYTTDIYQCEKLGYYGAEIQKSCPDVYTQEQPIFTTQGSLKLKPMTAKVWDLGLVFQPYSNLTISTDFMHWGISNEVITQPSGQLLTWEAGCRLGTLDPNSQQCIAALSQVIRDSSGLISEILVPKANVSNEVVNTLLTQVNWAIPTTKYGDFLFTATWTDMLKHTFQQYDGDVTYDELRDPEDTGSTDFKSKINMALSWEIGKFGATVYVDRYGRTPNCDATQPYTTTVICTGANPGTVGVYTITNLSLRYQVMPQLLLQLTANNLFNDMPPSDPTYLGNTNLPFNLDNYSVVGRQYSVEATYKFLK